MSAFNGSNGTIKVDLKSLLGAEAAYTRTLSDSIECSLRTFILEKNKAVHKIEFDFSEIVSVSRAFAHEFFKLISKLEHDGKMTELSGLNPNVHSMITLFKEGKGNLRSDRRDLTEGDKVDIKDLHI
jgi:hypothetical protein